MKLSFIRTLLVVAMLGMSVLLPNTVSAAPANQQDLPDIVETAVSAGTFETLVTALGAAGLVETLQGDGPFTVFAPTDDAFAALPEGTLDALLADPEGVLTDILLYHVIAGEVTAVDAVNSIGGSVEMLNGQVTMLNVVENRLLLNDAGFVAMNIQASNGVIHVIDRVLIPTTTSEEAEAAPAEEEMAEEEMSEEAAPAEEEMAEEGDMEEAAPAEAESSDAVMSDIVDTAVAAGSFNTLVTAVQAAGLTETLKSEGPFTVFAPTDDAFAALPEGTIDALLADPTGALTDVLLYHVVAGKVMAADVVGLDGEMVTTVGGGDLTISVTDNGVMVNNATVVTTDIETSNGVIHVIDTVLVPAAATEEEMGEESMDGEMEEATEEEQCTETHTVARGDTLSEVAAVYGVNIQTLVELNHISNPNVIRTGTVLCLN